MQLYRGGVVSDLKRNVRRNVAFASAGMTAALEVIAEKIIKSAAAAKMSLLSTRDIVITSPAGSTRRRSCWGDR